MYAEQFARYDSDANLINDCAPISTFVPTPECDARFLAPIATID